MKRGQRPDKYRAAQLLPGVREGLAIACLAVERAVSRKRFEKIFLKAELMHLQNVPGSCS